MSERKRNDERRFDFCLRCLEEPGISNQLIEHHLMGRTTNMYDVAFICKSCNLYVEANGRPIEPESNILREKKALLVSSSSLRFVIKNYKNVLESFKVMNNNGPNLSISPSGISYDGYFGAVGRSGKKYYFIPEGFIDQYTGANNKEAQLDGIGGVAGNEGGWTIFKGAQENSILGKFVSLHAQHSPEVVDISSLL